MAPENTPQPDHQQSSAQPQMRERTAEKVIQPLNPDLVAPATIATPVRPQPTPNNTVTLNAYDPTAATSYRTPSLQSQQPIEDSPMMRVAVRHKSLMTLAILGLLSTCFSVYQVVEINRIIHSATTTVDTSSAQLGLYILYANIVFNLVIYTYFLLAKDAHTVATILKVLLVLQFISVFGIFWGGAATRGATLLVSAAYLLFTYVVFNIVKSPQGA